MCCATVLLPVWCVSARGCVIYQGFESDFHCYFGGWTLYGTYSRNRRTTDLRGAKGCFADRAKLVNMDRQGRSSTSTGTVCQPTKSAISTRDTS
jgi:hypothetical protein